jgi:hypothetical protein
MKKDSSVTGNQDKKDAPGDFPFPCDDQKYNNYINGDIMH